VCKWGWEQGKKSPVPLLQLRPLSEMIAAFDGIRLRLNSSMKQQQQQQQQRPLLLRTNEEKTNKKR
jgi:hypothetical protein